MRIFKTKWVARFVRRERINDASLKEAIERAERGIIDADLGGGLIKQRVARPGRGRSGGFRMIVAYRTEERAFFLYGFAKNERGNIDKDEEEALKKLSAHLLSLPAQAMDQAARAGELIEVNCDA